MRRLSSSFRPYLREERGAVAILVAIVMVVLLGFAALVIDVGAVYAEKAQLQAGADAAALAIADDCAAETCGAVYATGQYFADANAGDNSSGIASITFPSDNTVRVETNAREAGTGADHFSLYFARILGFDTAEIGAVAEASWGSPTAAATLPWTISQCVFEQFLSASQLADLHATGNFTGDPDPTHFLLRYDTNTPTYPGCEAQNGYEPGGFGWLDTDGTCSTLVDVAAEEAESDTGNNFPSECEGQLATLMDEPVLVPLFDSATDSGTNATYSLTGFAAFQVTGWKFSGDSSMTNLDPDAPSCTGNCRGIQGYFTSLVSLEDGLEVSGTAPNFGASLVTLTR